MSNPFLQIILKKIIESGKAEIGDSFQIEKRNENLFVNGKQSDNLNAGRLLEYFKSNHLEFKIDSEKSVIAYDHTNENKISI